MPFDYGLQVEEEENLTQNMTYLKEEEREEGKGERRGEREERTLLSVPVTRQASSAVGGGGLLPMFQLTQRILSISTASSGTCKFPGCSTAGLKSSLLCDAPKIMCMHNVEKMSALPKEAGCGVLLISETLLSESLIFFNPTSIFSLRIVIF